MSNLEKHAEEEMRRAGLYDKSADYGGMIPQAVRLKDFLDRTKACLGKIFTGWKGGDYQMDAQTPLWVTTDPGISGSVALMGVEVSTEGHWVMLTTKVFEDQ